MVYIDNIYWGLLIFPFIAAVFTLPYALYQYNKYGSVSKFRTLIIYSFILYMLIAFFMVCLPLPDWESTVGNRWQDHLNLIPFRQIWLYFAIISSRACRARSCFRFCSVSFMRGASCRLCSGFIPDPTGLRTWRT